jgi:hypothetical protein
VTEFRKKKEEYLLLTLIAFVLLALEILMRNTLFKNIP